MNVWNLEQATHRSKTHLDGIIESADFSHILPVEHGQFPDCQEVRNTNREAFERY